MARVKALRKAGHALIKKGGKYAKAGRAILKKYKGSRAKSKKRKSRKSKSFFRL